VTTIRVVLDTNIVVSALLFADGRLSWIRRAWQQGRIRPLVCKETTEELLRVLTYPKFKLTSQERDELLADFLPYTEAVPLPQAREQHPECRDPNDRIFLELAAAAQVTVLVSGDADLLALRGKASTTILSAPELKARLASGPGLVP
jgi:putative PIN family toxin of toxin-antitoxin system